MLQGRIFLLYFFNVPKKYFGEPYYGLLLQVAQATSNQISKRDPLRPYMDVIDDFLTQMVNSLILFVELDFLCNNMYINFNFSV